MSTLQAQQPLNFFRVAWQSALAAGFCLGLPAGLLLWLILLQQIYPSAVTQQILAILQANGLNKIFVLVACSLMWSFLLARISDYRPWWSLGFATMLGIFLGWFSPLSNLDAMSVPGTPLHVVYAIAMCDIVASVTLCVGLLYGLLLRSGRAALTLAFTTSLVSILAVLVIVILFDQFGIRVGTGNFAMSKVTVMSLLFSAIMGGMVLGVGFTRFVMEKKQYSAFS